MFKNTLSVAVLAMTTLSFSNAQAQTAQPTPAQPEQVKIIELVTAEDEAAVLDARLAALKAVIGLKADQEKLWTPVDAAIRQVAKNAITRRDLRAKAPQPQSFVDVFERSAEAESLRATDVKLVTSALKPLVAALSEGQQRRIPAFLGLREGRFGKPQPLADLWLFEDES